MDVVRHDAEILASALPAHHHRLVAPLEDVTPALAATVPALAEDTHEPLHAAHQIRFRRLQQPVEMMTHQNVRLAEDGVDLSFR